MSWLLVAVVSLGPDAARAGQTEIRGEVVRSAGGRVEVSYELPRGVAPASGDNVVFELLIRDIPAHAGEGIVVVVEATRVWVEGDALDPPRGATAVIRATGDQAAAAALRAAANDATAPPSNGSEPPDPSGMRDAATSPEGVPDLRARAEAGDAAAQLELAMRYGRGDGVTRDVELATYWMRQAAEAGHPRGQYHYGELLHHGQGLPVDYDEARRWYELAAGQGEIGAMHNLAALHFDDLVSAPDEATGRDYLERAAAGGYPVSLFVLGTSYHDGRNGYPRDHDLALEYLGRSADAGYDGAQFRLAQEYRQGHEVVADRALAFDLYLAAAEQGHARAQFHTGVALDFGYGVAKDDAAGCDWYERAAEQGHGVAISNLGLCFEHGDGRPLDADRAMHWYRRGIEAGNTSAMRHAAELLLVGPGASVSDPPTRAVASDVQQEAEALYRRACDLGDGEACSDLSIVYMFGRGLTEDRHEAWALLEEACGRDVGKACRNLGLLATMHPFNDIDAALRYLARGCDLGTAAACEWIADLYYEGYSDADSRLRIDPDEAARWYQRCVDIDADTGACARRLAQLQRRR